MICPQCNGTGEIKIQSNVPGQQHPHTCSVCGENGFCVHPGCKLPRDKWIICDTCFADKDKVKRAAANFKATGRKGMTK